MQPNKAEPAQTCRDAQQASEIIAAMSNAEKTGEELRMKVTDVVKINNWTESLAKAVLARLDDAIKVRPPTFASPLMMRLILQLSLRRWSVLLILILWTTERCRIERTTERGV